jgi:hypothetical protein
MLGSSRITVNASYKSIQQKFLFSLELFNFVKIFEFYPVTQSFYDLLVSSMIFPFKSGVPDSRHLICRAEAKIVLSLIVIP